MTLIAGLLESRDIRVGDPVLSKLLSSMAGCLGWLLGARSTDSGKRAAAPTPWAGEAVLFQDARVLARPGG